MEAFYEENLQNNTMDIFWTHSTALLVENLYITTQNMDLFLEPFTDKDASEITYAFILVHEAALALIPFHPEMEELQLVLQPLYRINAMNKDQFRDQLIGLKGDIETVRNHLLPQGRIPHLPNNQIPTGPHPPQPQPQQQVNQRQTPHPAE